jgi:ubiquinone/menaquinone biosynthesis C-methylase UbiE
MKLQVGSSDVTKKYETKEWINLDINLGNGVNVLGSGTHLPFADNSFDEVHCIHVLEHVTRDKYNVMLKEMYRVVKPGHDVYVETPDFEQTVENLCSAFRACDYNAVHIWTTSVYGKNERPGMAHFMGFHTELLKNAMFAQGFRVVRRLDQLAEMISTHYRQEPILLMRGTK